eukprot:GHVQ01040542.1.p1 GENE.GHVQ01040542.1~~GHVQ01040542.1.p1  ORF type:complete len:313 (+),score=62.20 GHVQ01040542.1:757-1695(+)
MTGRPMSSTDCSLKDRDGRAETVAEVPRALVEDGCGHEIRGVANSACQYVVKDTSVCEPVCVSGDVKGKIEERELREVGRKGVTQGGEMNELSGESNQRGCPDRHNTMPHPSSIIPTLSHSSSLPLSPTDSNSSIPQSLVSLSNCSSSSNIRKSVSLDDTAAAVTGPSMLAPHSSGLYTSFMLPYMPNIFSSSSGTVKEQHGKSHDDRTKDYNFTHDNNSDKNNQTHRLTTSSSFPNHLASSQHSGSVCDISSVQRGWSGGGSSSPLSSSANYTSDTLVVCDGSSSSTLGRQGSGESCTTRIYFQVNIINVL